MKCLFCKQSSADTKSVEHIVPESLGNTTFILPLGYVCDKCNNYFAREVEKPFLELPELRLLRFQEAIPNKKNRMPAIDGLLNGNYPIKLKRKLSHDEVVNEAEVSAEAMDKILKTSEKTTIIVPAFTNDMLPPNNSIISRFLAKMALEALADKLKDIENSLEDLINDSQFDMLRNHARLGNIKNWPCSIRRIYDYNKIWKYSDGLHGQMVHESDFLLIPVEENFELAAEYIMAEIYFVIVLWGIEFAINMAGPEIIGYENWLKSHDDKSPLYCGNNENL
ncbi:MAG: HNH endonuclease [Lachnospiraceae bacterium]|nr:HNH endonuclease [Lachnospiraceae bacterium]